jgi:hypothetical protein
MELQETCSTGRETTGNCIVIIFTMGEAGKRRKRRKRKFPPHAIKLDDPT